MMQGFLIRLREINADNAYQLYLYARIRCSEFSLIADQTNTSITLFIGILHEPVSLPKFMKNMRKKLSNWNIEPVTNKLWLEELTIDEFIRVYGGFSQLKSKAASDAIVRDLANTEVARIMKAKSMEFCQRQILKYDRFILRAAFNALRPYE